MRFPDIRGSDFSNRKTAICDIEKSHSKQYKTIVYEEFEGIFAKRDQKEAKTITVTAFSYFLPVKSKTLINIEEN